MILKVITSLAALAIPAALFAQSTPATLAANPGTLDSPYQVNYASNLNIGDGVVNITNSGASAGANAPLVNGNSYGDICVSVYVYAPDQELAACCSCLVSPNSLHAMPVSYGPGNLLSNVNNTTVLASINQTHSVVIKLLAAGVGDGNTTNPTCNVQSRNSPTATIPTLANGMIAWGTHSHPTNTTQAAITETPFTSATLSLGEYNKLSTDCGQLQTTGSGRQCPGCITGGMSTSLQ